MNQGRYVFTQLIDFLPRKYFEWLVKKYDGNKYVDSSEAIYSNIFAIKQSFALPTFRQNTYTFSSICLYSRVH